MPILQRSCWKIPKSAMLVAEGDPPAFADIVVYDSSTLYVYALAAQWDRPDLAVAGATRESLIQPTRRARFLRTTVRRAAADPADPVVVLDVKASQVGQNDEVLSVDNPVVLFAGDVAEDIVGQPAMIEAQQRIAQENP